MLDLSTTSATIHGAVYHTYGDASVKLYYFITACSMHDYYEERTMYAALNLKRNLLLLTELTD